MNSCAPETPLPSTHGEKIPSTEQARAMSGLGAGGVSVMREGQHLPYEVWLCKRYPLPPQHAKGAHTVAIGVVVRQDALGVAEFCAIQHSLEDMKVTKQPVPMRNFWQSLDLGYLPSRRCPGKEHQHGTTKRQANRERDHG